MKLIKIFTDGGSSGNPGPSAIAFVVYNGEEVICKFSRSIGWATNNVAEYQAVIAALKWLVNNLPEPSREFHFDLLSDSQLVVNQLNGLFKIKNKELLKLVQEIKFREKKISGKIFYHLIPREKNNLADSLVKTLLI